MNNKLLITKNLALLRVFCIYTCIETLTQHALSQIQTQINMNANYPALVLTTLADLGITKKRFHYFLSFYSVLVCIGTVVVWFSKIYIFYLTILSYFGLTIYFVGYFKFPQYIKNILYSFSLTLHVMVPLIFWTFLREAHYSDPRPVSRFFSFLVHGGDFVLIIIHFAMFKNPLPAISIIWNVAMMVLYATWAWVGYALTGVFVYPFIDFRDSSAKYAYPGILAFVVFLSYMWVLIHKYRDIHVYLAVE